MGSLRLALCASAVVAGALASAAYAADAQGVVLTPASPAPGSDVRLAVRGCSGTTGSAASDAFVAEARLVGRGGTLTGDTRIRSALPPGRYRVTVGCDGREIDDVLTVAGPTPSAPTDTPSAPTDTPSAPTDTPSTTDAPSTTGTSSPTGTATASGTDPTFPGPTASPLPSASSAHSSPVAPVRAGGGGTADVSSSDPRVAVPGMRHAVIGLLLVGVAVVVVVARGARRGRGRE
jgi:hypothetical protein